MLEHTSRRPEGSHHPSVRYHHRRLIQRVRDLSELDFAAVPQSHRRISSAKLRQLEEVDRPSKRTRDSRACVCRLHQLGDIDRLPIAHPRRFGELDSAFFYVELDSAYTGYSTLADLPAAMTRKAFRIQLDTYFWSYKLHANTYTLSQPQRVWVKSFLTCGSRARLHWRPQRNGPRSEECKPNLGHPPLPCIPNDVLLWILPFIKLCELGPAPPYQPATF